MAKRSKGEGTIYKDQRGYWIAQYRVDGKRKTISATTHTEVRDRLRAILADITNDEYIEPSKEIHMTMAQWAETWLEEYAKPSVKITTYECYESYIRNQIKPNIGNVMLANLTVDVFQRFFNLMAESGKFGGEKGLAVKTIYNLRNMMHYMLDQAVANRLIKYNPIDATRLPKRQKKEMRVLGKDEQMKLMSAVDASAEPAALGIKFALFTGVRIGEMLGLKWESVDMKNKEFRVREILRRVTNPDKDSAYTTVVASLQTTKSDSSNRTVHIIDELHAELSEYKTWQERRAAENPAFNPNNFVFTTVHGSYLEPRTYEDLFHRMVKAAGIAPASFHCLRHTFATRAIEQGMDVLVLAKILGHAQPSTTLNMYGHVLPDHKKESMEKIRSLYTLNESKTALQESEKQDELTSKCSTEKAQIKRDKGSFEYER